LSTFSGIPGIPTTSVPQIQFTPQGPIIPNDTDILAGAQIDINYAFGGGVNPALNTPQGQLASSLAAIIADKDGEIAYVVNQVDPQYATGRFQDAIGRLTVGMAPRIAAAGTVVNCILTGLVGTVVPALALAQDTSGNTYSLLGAVTIPVGGTVMSSWQNLAAGPISCPAGTLTQVYQAVPGWDAISNPTQGVLGRLVETPREFELRRQNSVAGNSRGSCEAIQAAVYKVPGVLDCYVIDNTKGSIVNKGSSNYPMLPHSLYVAVVGGIAADIAQAIWLKKDTGCDYNGNTSNTVLDTSPQYAPGPYPSYLVQFNVPTNTQVLFAVSIINSPTLPTNIVALVQAAIIAQFNGGNGQNPARMGAAITGSSYYGAVLAVALGITVLSVLVGIASATLPQVIMGIDQEPVLQASDITVTLV
jgi:hypothetical protein